jgi:hypothetical protein
MIKLYFFSMVFIIISLSIRCSDKQRYYLLNRKYIESQSVKDGTWLRIKEFYYNEHNDNDSIVYFSTAIATVIPTFDTVRILCKDFKPPKSFDLLEVKYTNYDYKICDRNIYITDSINNQKKMITIMGKVFLLKL